MNFLQNILNESLVQAIGWTIVHSIWQGGLIVVLAALVLSIFNNPSSKLKYNVYTTALFAILASSMTTFGYLHHHIETTHKIEWVIPTEVQNDNNNIIELVFTTNHFIASETQEAETGVSAFFTQMSSLANEYMGLIVVLWMLGCLFFSIRFIGGFLYIQRLKRRYIYPVEAHWRQKLEVICQQIGIQKTVRLMESALVKAPMVIGHLKPIILFPIGALSGLNPSQVEAILAHELAHVYRNDYLVNILQSLAEIVLFYHPAAWWLSGKMETAREHSCDDLAISLCGDRLVYAKALTEIESIRLQEQTPYLAAAFAGKSGGTNLMERVQRLFSPSENKFSFLDGWVASLMLLIALLAFSWTSHSTLEAAEKEVSVFIESVVDDLGETFFEITADSSKRAERKHKQLKKEQSKLIEQSRKLRERMHKNKNKIYILKGESGQFISPPTPPILPTPPMAVLPEMDNPNILVIPDMPQLPLPLLEGITEMPLPPVIPVPPAVPVPPALDLSSLHLSSPDLTIMMSEQPDVWEHISNSPSQILFLENGVSDLPLIIKSKDKDKWKHKLKTKMKFKNKGSKIKIIDLNVQLDSIKQRELREKLQPLRDSIDFQQNRLRESMKDLQNLDEAKMEGIIRDYERALDRYEDELEDWQDNLEHQYEYQYEWNEKDREAFEEKMEKWGEEFGEKFSQQWNEKDWNDWAEKWEAWGEKFGENFSKENAKKWEDWGENFGKHWNEKHWKDWAKKMEEWGENFGKQWNEQHWEEWADRMEEWGEKWENEWENHQDEYEHNMDKWQQEWEEQMNEYEKYMDKYEGELNLFEDAYEEALEREEGLHEVDLKDFAANIREMLEADGLIKSTTRNVEIKFNGKVAKVNGKEIPSHQFDKYNDLFRDRLGDRARWTLKFNNDHDNIMLRGKNMEIYINED